MYSTVHQDKYCKLDVYIMVGRIKEALKIQIDFLVKIWKFESQAQHKCFSIEGN